MKNFILLCALIMLQNISFAQTGPGGVGSDTNLDAWMDASRLVFSSGDSISSWADLSGNSNDADEVASFLRPTFVSNEINGQPAVDFSDNAMLEFSTNITTSATTIFSVHSTPASSVSTSPFAFSNHTILETPTDQIFPIYFNPTQASTRVNKTRGSFSIFSLRSEGGLSGVNVTVTNVTSSNSLVRSEGGGLASSNIGCRNFLGYRNFFSGKIAELIVFNEEINSAKRKIVGSHLAAKYNLTAEQNLYAFGSTHGNQVIGIGQESDGSHTTAKGLDSLQISNPSALGNGDYLLIGNDGGGFTSSLSVDATVTQRWTQVWRADVTGSPGTIDLIFFLDANDFATDPNDYAVLIENVDGDFSNGGTSLQETGRIYDGINKTVTFTGITLADGDYFTLAEKATIVPPVPTALLFGPGGVGTNVNIEAWMDASQLALTDGDSISSWSDLSGNSNNADEVGSFLRPTFQTNEINGQPVMDFSGSAILEFSTNISTTATTIFSVHNTPASAVSTSPFAISNHTILETPTNQIFPIYFNPTQASTRVNKTRGSFSVFSLRSEGGLSGVNATVTNAASSKSLVRNEGGALASSNIGCRNFLGYRNFFSGQIAELIIFNEEINSAKRKIVGNHLAAKYNLTAEQNLYAFGATYGKQVIGVGQESDGDHLESRGIDSLLIRNPSSLGNGDYILIGNDNEDFGVSAAVSAMIIERWNRVWRADLTGTPGTIDMEFFLGANGFAAISSYVILIDDDGDFTSGATMHSTGRSFSVTNNSISFTGVNLPDGAHFTLAELSPNPTAIADGNWENTATWSCGCIPNSSLDVTIPATFDVTINELANARDLTIEAGGSLTLGGNDTLQLVGDLSISGTFTSGIGTLQGSGGSSQTFANSSGVNVALNNLVANNSASVLLTGGWTLSNNLHVSSGTLDVSGSDSLVLLSTVSKTAQILESAGTFVGDFTLQRFIPSTNSNFGNLSAPTSNATVASIDDDLKLSGVSGNNGNALALNRVDTFYSVYSYNRGLDKSDTITSTATTLDPGVGYEVYLFNTLTTMNDTTIDYVGTPNFGAVTPPSIDQGFNLVGNPYQSFIEFDNLDQTNILNNFYIYQTSTGTYGLFGTGDNIAPGQGFWVEKSTSGSAAFDFEESDKISSNSSTFIRKKKSAEFTLELSNDVNFFKNKVQIGFDYSATEGIDQFDASYLPSPHKNASELYAKTIFSDKLIKNTLSQFEESHSVALELKVGDAGNYLIESKNLNTLLENYSCIYLNDKETNEHIDLSVTSSYSFNAESGVSDRFSLILSNSFEDCEAKMKDESSNQKIDSKLNLRESYGDWFLDYKLGNNSQQFKISVYSLNGQLAIPTNQISLTENGSFQLSGLNNLKGIFVIQIIGQEEVINKTIKL